FDTNLTIPDLYGNDTIETLAKCVGTQPGVHGKYGDIDKEIKEAAAEIETLKTGIMETVKSPDGIEDIYPMSDIETGMIFAASIQPGEALYHDQIIYRVTYRDFSPHHFKQALESMTQKHAILRTGFNIKDYSQPVQIVYKKMPPGIRNYDISTKGRKQQQEHVKNYLVEDRKNPFEIAGPLWRIRSFHLGGGEILVLLVCHHAIMDGWSVASFSTELNNIYRELKKDPQHRPQPLRSNYKDFVIEQMAWKRHTPTTDYWKKELEQYKRLDIKSLRGTRAPADESSRTITYTLPLEKQQAKQLEQVALTGNTSLKHLYFAAYLYMLGMMTYENDIVPGIVTHNRPLCEDADKILGCF
ncbi:MAG: hypothetical protein GY757_28445, partial [bacterium]|nr:hypothetical protein [bacterium]